MGIRGVSHRLEPDRDTKQLVHGNRHLTSVSGTESVAEMAADQGHLSHINESTLGS